MIKMTMIGHLGKDAEVKIHGTESVINFSVAHTDKWRDGNGVEKQKTTWVSCSWWLENHSIAQYMKKGTQVYIEGIPEARVWKKDDKPEPYLNMRVFSLQLLGSAPKKEEYKTPEENKSYPNQNEAYKPYKAPLDNADVDDLPF